MPQATADKFWFFDKTIQQQRRVFSLEEMWRFLEVQIEFGGVVEKKVRELDKIEDDVEEIDENFS